MAKSVSTTAAGFKLTLVNTENPSEVYDRTVSFDLPIGTTIRSADQLTTAASLFAAAGMSNVFQPTGWRDYMGELDVCTIQAITPILTEKVVSTADEITVQSGQA
mgnify:CR=1 FL=1